MIRFLDPATYRVMRWANGLGETVEMMRVEDEHGLVWRLSRATVTEDGPFSVFPGINRCLTVLTGSGFDLVGDRTLRADPLVPVFFAGDEPISARNVREPCQDLNLMISRRLPTPEVFWADGTVTPPEDGLLALYCHAAARVADTDLGPDAVVLSDGPVTIAGGRVLVMRLAPATKGLQVLPLTE